GSHLGGLYPRIHRAIRLGVVSPRVPPRRTGPLEGASLDREERGGEEEDSMKAIMVMFDSLNRHMLPPYGCNWTHAPNFRRLAERTVTFSSSYVCSMPCMPARRDLHTGRPNFLHRAWGPLEPFDDSVPEILKQAGVYTHLASDHYHYWEDGGATYHNRYSSWEFFRGQEGDPWVGQVQDPALPANALGRHSKLDPYSRQDLVNREAMRREADQPQPQTFAAGLD